MLSLSCLSLNKKISKKTKISWLHDNYIILNTILQNYEGVIKTRGIPRIKELYYYENTTNLNGIPVKIAKLLLDHHIFNPREEEAGLVYYKFITAPFFFICKEFLELFGQSKHIYFSQLKDKFSSWKYNLTCEPSRVLDVDECRNTIFDLIDSLKRINAMEDRSNTEYDRTQIQHRLVIQYTCLYHLSKLTLHYKKLLSNEQYQQIDTIGIIDMKIFNIDIDHPFDYDVPHIYKYIYSSELVYKHETVHLRTVVKSDWKQEKPDECPVCLEEIGEHEHLSCGHYVHKCCLIKSKKTCCPMCKNEVKLEIEDIRQILS
jgi:hypothetical protein